MVICKNLDAADRITSLEEWQDKCVDEKHWKEERSAMELAKEWIFNDGENLKKLMERHNDFREVEFLKASPEIITTFDNFNKGRQHDLLIIGQEADEKVIISVEAKVDEPFDNDKVGSAYMKGLMKRLNGENTNAPERIEKLIEALFDKPYSNKIIKLKYQLLHAVAGTMAEAKKQTASKALFVVETFLTPDINMEKNRENMNDLDRFIREISSNNIKHIHKGEIHGPFYLPGNRFIPSDIALYIARIDH